MKDLPRAGLPRPLRAGGLPIAAALCLGAGQAFAAVRVIAPPADCGADTAELRRHYQEAFPAEAKSDPALSRVLAGPYDGARCREAKERFYAQVERRRPQLASAEGEIAGFKTRYPSCAAFVEPERTSVAVMSFPAGINGKLFGDAALINLFATRDDSPEQFHRLILHEWIHGFKTQRVDEPDDVSNLLFFEGQAVYGVPRLSDELSGMSIESSLQIDGPKLAQALELLCRKAWTKKELNALVPELFVGNNTAFVQPRMGYFLGAKVVERLSRSRAWCEIDLAYFREHFEAALAELQHEYCAGRGGERYAQAVRL